MWACTGNSKCEEWPAFMKEKSTVSGVRADPSDELSAIVQNTQVIEWNPHKGALRRVVLDMN